MNIGEISRQLHPISEVSPTVCLLCKTKCALNVSIRHKTPFIFLSFPSLPWENDSSIISEILLLMQSMSGSLFFRTLPGHYSRREYQIYRFSIPKGELCACCQGRGSTWQSQTTKAAMGLFLQAAAFL